MTLAEIYVKKFGETFPRYGIREEDSDKNLDDIIEDCIKRNEPYKPEYKDNCDY